MHITADDVDALARGCELVGSGGGGATGPARLILNHWLTTRPPVKVVRDLPDDCIVTSVGAVGAAALMLEDIPGPAPFVAVVETVRRQGHDVGAILPLEVGGVNGLLAVLAASATGLPLVDADPHGRAYTRVDHSVLGQARPMRRLAFASTGGQAAWFEAGTGEALERMVRSILTSAGGWGAIACHIGTADDVLRHAVPGTVSRAGSLGRALVAAMSGDPAQLVERPDVRELATGTVVEVSRWPGVEAGGVASIQHRRRGVAVRLDFANEFVALYEDGDLVASAPDMICVLDASSWRPVPVERIAVMQHVRILAIEAPEVLSRAQAATHRFGLAASGFAEVGGR